MKNTSNFKWLFAFALLIALQTSAQNESAYDASLAKKLGADEYGMKQYILVILTTGSATITDKSTLDSLFAGHMRNMGLLAEQQKLVMAGPLGKNNLAYRGIFILNTSKIEDAKAMVSTDPAVKADIFNAEYLEWYGSASLMLNNELHKKIQKTTF